MKSHCTRFILCLLVTALLPGVAFAQEGGVAEGSSAEPAFIITGGCPAKKLVYATTSDLDTVTTTSGGFVDVPGMVVTFKVPAKFPVSCIKVEWSAMSFAANTPVASQLLNVQATLDGAPIPPPDVQFSGDDSEDGDGAWARSHAFNWVTMVGSGTHIVKIRWRSVFGGSVFLHARTLAVHSH